MRQISGRKALLSVTNNGYNVFYTSLSAPDHELDENKKTLTFPHSIDDCSVLIKLTANFFLLLICLD